MRAASLLTAAPLFGPIAAGAVRRRCAIDRKTRRSNLFALTVLVSASCLWLEPATVYSAPPAGRTNAAEKRAALPARARIGASAGERVDPALSRRLASDISINWQQVPLRSALDDLAETGNFRLQLDRRTDPDQLVSAELRNVPIERGLQELIGKQQAAVSQFGPLVVVGPPAATQRLRTLAVLRTTEILGLSSKIRQRWLAVAEWSWPRLTTPRELFERLGKESGIELAGLERVPHDLWPAGKLPPLSVADRLTWLANQFDLTYAVDHNELKAELVPISGEVNIERTYSGGSNPAQLAQLWRSRAPAADIQIDGSQVIVTALVEDHERIRRPTTEASSNNRPQPKPKTSGQLVRIDRLEFKDLPLGGAIEGLGKRLNLKIEMDRPALERAGIDFQQPVSIDLRRATIDDVWDAVLKPVGLAFERDRDVVRITRKTE